MKTSKDVAKLARASRATVSAVINNKTWVSKELRKRIEDAIKTLNYQPNEIARSLKVKYTKTIGVVIPNIASPVFSYFVRGIEYYANKKGYKIILCNTGENYKEEKEILKVLLEKMVDGIIIIPCGSKNKDYINENIILLEKPIIFLDRKINGANSDIVIGNNIKGAYKISEFLINSGYKRLGIITHDLDLSLGKKRLDGYKKALKDNNIEIINEYMKSCSSTEEDGYSAIKNLINGSNVMPEVIIVASTHLTLIGILKYLKENNFNIPDDIGIVGFDDLPWVKFLDPPLTVISYDMYNMGEKAAEILINRINAKVKKPRTKKIIFEPELIIRKSTKVLNKSFGDKSKVV